MVKDKSKRKYWIAAKVKSNRIGIATTNLTRQNFEFFQPQFKTISKVRNKFKEIIKPVFPGYIFIAINPEEKNWHKINNTRGISHIIAFGNEVPLIDNKLIEEINDRFSLDNSSMMTNPLEVGMNTEISNGPFAQLIGKIESIDANQRIWILLDILGAQTRVSIDKLNLIPIK